MPEAQVVGGMQLDHHPRAVKIHAAVQRGLSRELGVRFGRAALGMSFRRELHFEHLEPEAFDHRRLKERHPATAVGGCLHEVRIEGERAKRLVDRDIVVEAYVVDGRAQRRP
eukprot:scaffold8041_cov122-Isochrysis_galbana.AAC.2